MKTVSEMYREWKEKENAMFVFDTYYAFMAGMNAAELNRKEESGTKGRDFLNGTNCCISNQIPGEWIITGYPRGFTEGECEEIISRARALTKKDEIIKVLKEALDNYDGGCYDCHDYTARDISHYAKNALAKVKEMENELF